MKINKLNESSSTAMKFSLVEPTDRKSELKVDKPTAISVLKPQKRRDTKDDNNL